MHDAVNIQEDGYRIIEGDCLDVLRRMPSESVQCCVTSPPYFGLRDYGTASWEGGDADCEHRVGRNTRGGMSEKQASSSGSFGDEAIRTGNACPHCGAVRVDAQIGLEATPAEFVAKMVEVFEEVRRVLRKDGTLWLNLGDSYANDSKWGGSPGGKHADGVHGSTGIGRGKTFTGLKGKDLIGIPWRVAFALQEAGWWLRQDIIWSKPNPMPESVTDRCTKSHEYLFLLTKSAKYLYNNEAIKEPCTYDDPRIHNDYEPARLERGFVGMASRGGGPLNKARKAGNVSHKYVDAYLASETEEHRTKAGLMNIADTPFMTRNKRSVWTVTTQPYSEAHFATFPPKLIEPCILAGSKEGDLILDPFCGSGTTGLVSLRHRRNFVGIELNPEYIKIAEKRLSDVQVKLF